MVFPKETVSALIAHHRNTKVKVCSPEVDTDFLDIVAGVWEGDILTSYSFIISFDYILNRLIDLEKEYLHTEKARSR